MKNLLRRGKIILKIKFLVMDVDGTLTDGKIYMGENGEMFKAFDIKDGCGIKDVLPEYSIVPIIITARKSKILKNRCKELAVNNLYQDVRDKLEKLEEIITTYNKENQMFYSLKNCAYIGDDLLDLTCMHQIKESGGLVGCPADAVDKVKGVSDYICSKKGGDGAIREFIEWIIKNSINT